MVSSRVYPDLERKPGGPDNWVEKVGGLPSFIERIAKHLHYERGFSISHAIATAVSQCKKNCAKGNAKACKAVAQWEAKKARTRIAATEVRGRKLTDFEFAEIISSVGYKRLEFVQRAPGASGSNRPFDESKYLRNPANGKFSAKYTPAELIAARRLVEGDLTNLQVGQSVVFPGDAGWAKRSESGYLIQGPAGIRVAVRTLSEAIQAATNIMAGKLSRVAQPIK
jgi:hypothetical protein